MRTEWEKETVGVVGIGHMGLPMSRRLIGGGLFRHCVRSLAPDAVQTAVESGAEAAESLADLGRRCATVITMLPNSAIIDAVVRARGAGRGDGAGEHADRHEHRRPGADCRRSPAGWRSGKSACWTRRSAAVSRARSAAA